MSILLKVPSRELRVARASCGAINLTACQRLVTGIAGSLFITAFAMPLLEPVLGSILTNKDDNMTKNNIHILALRW